MHNNYLYILIMFAVTYAIRVVPMTLIRKPIENRFVKSFLYYVPYVTLAVMTFPAIVDASGAWWVGALALIAGAVAAWFGAGLFPRRLVGRRARPHRRRGRRLVRRRPLPRRRHLLLHCLRLLILTVNNIHDIDKPPKRSLRGSFISVHSVFFS